jgi:hypothetical protein
MDGLRNVPVIRRIRTAWLVVGGVIGEHVSVLRTAFLVILASIPDIPQNE